jgi:hypothetical protein
MNKFWSYLLLFGSSSMNQLSIRWKRVDYLENSYSVSMKSITSYFTYEYQHTLIHASNTLNVLC